MEELCLAVCVLSVLSFPFALGRLRSVFAVRGRHSGTDVSVVIVAGPAGEDKLKKHVSAVYAAFGEETQIILACRRGGGGPGELEAAQYGVDVVRADYTADPARIRAAGARRAVYPLVFFIGSEVTASPEALRQTLACYTRKSVLSVRAWQTSVSAAGGIFGMRRVCALIVRAGASPKGASPGVFPEFMLLSREDFLASPAADADFAGDDAGLGASFKSSGLRVRSFLGDGRVCAPAAPGTPAELAGATPARLCAVLLALAGAAAAPAGLALGTASASAALMWLFACVTYGAVMVTFMKKTGEYSVFWGVLFPVQAAAAFLSLARDAAVLASGRARSRARSAGRDSGDHAGEHAGEAR